MHLEKENIDQEMAKSCYSSLIPPSIVEDILGSSKFKKVK